MLILIQAPSWTYPEVGRHDVERQLTSNPGGDPCASIPSSISITAGSTFTPALSICAFSTPKEIPGGSHLCRIDIGHGKEASPQQAGGLEGIDAVILGLGPMDGPHVESVAQDEGDALIGTEIGEPVPVEDALRSDNQVLPEGFDGFEKAGPVAGEVLVKQDVAFLILNAQIKGASVKVDPAVVLMLLGIEAHGSPPGLDVSAHSTSCLPTSG